MARRGTAWGRKLEMRRRLPKYLRSVCWLRGDLGITLNGANVSAWADQSGFAAHFSQAVAGNQPLWGSVKGQRAVQFGLDDFLAHTGAISSAVAGELWQVQSIATDPPSAGNSARTSWGAGTPNDHIPFTDGVVYDGFCSTVRHSTGNPTTSLAGTHIYNALSAANLWQSFIDGGQHFSTATNTVTWSAAPKLGDGSAIASIEGHLSEVLCLPRLATGSEKSQVEDYLSNRYGVKLL